MTQPPELLTVAEAAKVLRVHTQTAYQAIREGTFPVPVHTISKTYRVSRYDLERIINRPTGENAT